MDKFLTGNEWQWRFARTIAQGVLGVFVASGLFEWRPMSFLAEPGDLYVNEQSHVAMCQSQVPDILSGILLGGFHDCQELPRDTAR